MAVKNGITYTQRMLRSTVSLSFRCLDGTGTLFALSLCFYNPSVTCTFRCFDLNVVLHLGIRN